MINICFHGVGTPARALETGEQRYWVEKTFFDGVLDRVRDRTDVAISFDDGNESDVLVGLRGLLRRGLRASFFVLAGRLDEPGSLSRTSVRALRSEGMTVGTHGMDHVPWRGLAPEQQTREWELARRMIEDVVETPVLEAALPLGRYDRRVLSSLRALGYARVHTSDRRPSVPGAWLVPRYSVTAADDVAAIQEGVLTGPGWTRRAALELKGLGKRYR